MNLTFQPTQVQWKKVLVKLESGQVGERQMFAYDAELEDSTILGMRFEPANSDFFSNELSSTHSPTGLAIYISTADAVKMLIILKDKKGDQIMKPYPLMGLGGFRARGLTLQPHVTMRMNIEIATRKCFITYSTAFSFSTTVSVYAVLTVWFKRNSIISKFK